MKKILSLILGILLIPTIAFSQQCSVGSICKVRIDDFSGGMNSNSLADILQPNQGASVVNVSLSRPGIISKRKGQDLFLKDVGNTAFRGLGRFDPDATTSYLVVASGTDIVRATASATQWASANRVAGKASPLTAGKDTEFVQANDLLFILNGFDSTAWYTGSLWFESTAYPTSPPTATTGLWLKNYLFLAGATTENDWVYFSNNLDPIVFDASDIVKINTGDGQKIIRLMAYRESEIIIYKERSIFLMDISSTSVPGGWTVQPISTTTGTVSPRSVVSLGNDQWFLSTDPIAVRSLVRTDFDKILLDQISAPIQDILDRTGEITDDINLAVIEKSAAILFDNKFFLAIPVGTSTVNNLVLVYDFNVQGWSLIKTWFPAEWVLFNKKLYYIDANDGRVIECFAETIGDWAEGPSFIDSASSPTIGTNFEYVSRALNFDYPENYKELDSIEVEFNPTGNYYAIVYVNLDNTGWASAGSVNLAGLSNTLPITLPTTLSNAGVVRSTFDLSDKGEFKKLQVWVHNAGLGNDVDLQRITAFGRVKPWTRTE